MVALEHIAAATRTDNGDMLQLARYNREDTINLKTLTRITIVYLPGSLIAVNSSVWTLSEDFVD